MLKRFQGYTNVNYNVNRYVGYLCHGHSLGYKWSLVTALTILAYGVGLCGR